MDDAEANEIIARLTSRLREIRVAKGMSVNHLAGLASLDQMAVARIEKGERSPTLRSLLKIAAALEVRLSEELGQVDLK